MKWLPFDKIPQPKRQKVVGMLPEIRQQLKLELTKNGTVNFGGKVTKGLPTNKTIIETVSNNTNSNQLKWAKVRHNLSSYHRRGRQQAEIKPKNVRVKKDEESQRQQRNARAREKRRQKKIEREKLATLGLRLVPERRKKDEKFYQDMFTNDEHIFAKEGRELVKDIKKNITKLERESLRAEKLAVKQEEEARQERRRREKELPLLINEWRENMIAYAKTVSLYMDGFIKNNELYHLDVDGYDEQQFVVQLIVDEVTEVVNMLADEATNSFTFAQAERLNMFANLPPQTLNTLEGIAFSYEENDYVIEADNSFLDQQTVVDSITIDLQNMLDNARRA